MPANSCLASSAMYRVLPFEGLCLNTLFLRSIEVFAASFCQSQMIVHKMKGIFNNRALLGFHTAQQLISILTGLAGTMYIIQLHAAVKNQLLIQQIANISALDVYVFQFFTCFLEAAGGVQPLDETQMDKGTILIAFFRELFHDLCILSDSCQPVLRQFDFCDP